MKTIRVDAEVHDRLARRRAIMRETNPRATYSDAFRELMEVQRMARDAKAAKTNDLGLSPDDVEALRGHA